MMADLSEGAVEHVRTMRVLTENGSGMLFPRASIRVVRGESGL